MSGARRIVLAAVALAAAAVFLSRGVGDERDARARGAAPDPASRSGGPASELARADEAGTSAATATSAEPARPERSPPAAVHDASRSESEAAPFCVAHGRVRATDGVAIPEWQPSVVATDASGERVIVQSAAGHYVIPGLAPGAWTVSASAVGFRESSATVELTEQAPIARADLALERAVLLAIRFTTPEGGPLYAALRARREEGLPVPEAPLPVATREPPGATIDGANGAEQNPVRDGSFWDYGPLLEAAPPDSAGVLELTCELPAYVSLVAGARVLETRRVEPGETEVEFVVGLDTLEANYAVVRGRFVDADGAGATGELWLDPIDRARMLNGQPWSESLPPGEYTLRFTAYGLAWFHRRFTLEAGEDLDLGDVVLEPELTISGRLLDAEGRPVRAAVSLGQRDERGRLRFDDRIGFASDANGAYEVTGLVAGRYALRVEPSNDGWRTGERPREAWVSGNVAVSTLGGSVTGFDIQLVRAGFVVLGNGKALPRVARCKVLDGSGDVLRYDGLYPGYIPRLALPPGAYTLVLCDEEWNELSRRALDVGEGTLELDLAP